MASENTRDAFMGSITDVIDRIDELVDGQLADGEPVNVDGFGEPDYPRCPHCGRHWHGLPITRRIAEMYNSGSFDPEYRYAEDDSPILCEGSTFIGPPRPCDEPVSTPVSIVVADFGTYVAADLRGWRGLFQQTRALFEVLARDSRATPFKAIDPITFGRCRVEHSCPRGDIVVEFGPQNWHYELRPRVSAVQQLPSLLVDPQTWAEFARQFPVPPRPGLDFSDYVENDDPPLWAPAAGRRARTTAPTGPHHRAARAGRRLSR